MMKLIQKSKLWLACLLAGTVTVFSEADLKPLQMGTAWEFGQVIKGVEREQGAPVEMEAITRLGVAITQVGTYGSQYEFKMGVGGLFWNPYPHRAGGGFTLNTRFGPGITQATGIYHFGDFEKKNFYLQFGFFPIKYNPDIKNLGEYLFRSGTYPPVVRTGGVKSWTMLNGADYTALGFHLHYSMMNGSLNHDLTLFMERDFAPYFDLTPSYLVSLNGGDIFTVGAGVSFNHFIPMIPSKLRPTHDKENLYLDFANFPVSAGEYEAEEEDGVIVTTTVRPDWAGGPRDGMYPDLQGYLDTNGLIILDAKMYSDVMNLAAAYSEADIAALGLTPTDKVWVNALFPDSSILLAEPAVNEDLYIVKATGALVKASDRDMTDSTIYAASGIQEYNDDIRRFQVTGNYVYPREETWLTIQGIKTTAWAAFDVKPLLGDPGIFGKEDLKIYAEWAILGVQNQPYYYENITKRMPIMVGINLPAFKILDYLAVEMEYYNSDWPNNSQALQQDQLPVPYVPEQRPSDYKSTTADDTKWSITAKRSIGPLTLFAQAASDHFRTIGFEGRPSYEPVVDRMDEWYYMLRFQFGL